MENLTSLTPLEVANILNISKNTVYEMVKRGDLNSYKVGNRFRFDREDIETYKKKNKRLKEEVSVKKYNFEDDICRFEELKRNSFIICGQDILLNTLCRHLLQKNDGVLALNSHIGCYNSLYELYLGNAQIAAVHMWDGDSGEYNIPYVKKMLPGISAIIIHLAKRKQGMYVEKGNPKNIYNWEDLKRSDISIANREIGSGTRILLDEHLKKMSISADRVNGYKREFYSNTTAINAVVNRSSDVAIGMETHDNNSSKVDFIPLQNESLDLVIKREDFYKIQFISVINILRSKEFKFELNNIVDYDLEEIGEIIAET